MITTERLTGKALCTQCGELVSERAIERCDTCQVTFCQVCWFGHDCVPFLTGEGLPKWAARGTPAVSWDAWCRLPFSNDVIGVSCTSRKPSSRRRAAPITAEGRIETELRGAATSSQVRFRHASGASHDPGL